MMQYGVQLFGCSREFRKGPHDFFVRMKAAGIEQIEPCILFDDPVEFKNKALASGNSFAAALPDLLWSPAECPVFAKELQALDMKLTSAHVFVADIEAAQALLLETAQKSGITAYVMNTPAWAKEEPQKFSGQLTALAKALKPLGTEVWLHNGRGDVAAKVGEMSLYEYILRSSENVFAQPDTGWVHYDGQEPYAYIKNLGALLRCLHLKDIAGGYENKNGTDIFAVLGEGCVDTQKALTLAGPGVAVVIDQDVSQGDFLADLEKSAAFLKSL